MAGTVARGSTQVKSQRMQVIMPAPLAKRLRERVPPRGRSAYIARAVEQAIDAEEQMKKQQLEPEGQIWGDEDYPYLNTADDIRDFREAIWSGDDPHQVLRRKYAKGGVSTKRDFKAWLQVWRETGDPNKAFAVVATGKKPPVRRDVKRSA
jgi:hypothetical protein